MKGQYFPLLRVVVCSMIMLAVTTSCEKMNVSEGNDDEHFNVVLRVGSYEQTPFPARTREVATDHFSRLNFLVYDQSGERIRQVEQKVDDSAFGRVGLSLAEGHYFLVVLAHSGSGNPTSTNARKIGFTNQTGFTDTFLYADSLFVEGTDIDKSVALQRIVAMVRFVMEDAIPDEADRIRFYYTGGSGSLDAVGGGWGVVNSKQVQFYDISHHEQKFEIYTIPHGDTDQLNVTATTYKGENDNIVTERKIEGIPVLRNHITTCRGHLFYPVSDIQFVITIDGNWDEDIIDFPF